MAKYGYVLTILPLAGLLFTVSGCSGDTTDVGEAARTAELERRAFVAATGTTKIPDAVQTATKDACEKDLRDEAAASAGQRQYAIETFEFDGAVHEYDLRNRPHAYDIGINYSIRMAKTGEILSYTRTCRVADNGNVSRIPA